MTYQGKPILNSGIKNKTRNLHLPLLMKSYQPEQKLSSKLRGCNLSYWKSDLIAVNGYNEDMVGWGREDSEIIHRMNNNGVFGQRLKFKAILLHIWHKNKPKDKLEANNIIQENAIKHSVIRCKNGIDKYLE